MNERIEKDRVWKRFTVQCAQCGTPNQLFTGYVFQAETKGGRRLTFCNIDCCEEYEKDIDKRVDRRGAIAATKRKKEARNG